LAGEEIINDLKYEPSTALYPDQDDPDIFYKKIAELTKDSFHHNSICYLEMNEFRVDQIRTYFIDSGWSDVKTRKDLQGKERMLKAHWIA
jgi:release factor glutamine methyltransferase